MLKKNKTMREITMLIIKIQGGLGNQMFEYSVAKWLQNQGKTVTLDVSHYNSKYNKKSDVVHNGYELERLFNLSVPYATTNEVKLLGDTSRNPFSRARRAIFGKKKTHYTSDSFEGRRWFYPELAEIDNGYLDGSWCSFKYAEQCESIIRSEFDFKLDLEGKNRELSKELESRNSVSIHVRHGDYLKLQNIYNILSDKYYLNCMDYIKKRIENAEFYCFSDDINWCKSVFGDQVNYVDWNTGNNSCADMQLMSCCKHNIIANSTFSMWGAWLNENPEKIVLCPKRVFVNESDEFPDFFLDKWIRI